MHEGVAHGREVSLLGVAGVGGSDHVDDGEGGVGVVHHHLWGGGERGGGKGMEGEGREGQ